VQEVSTVYFRELECRHYFYATLTTDPWALSQGLTHEIPVRDSRRFCRFSPKRSRAYVAVDEGDQGEAILETWKILEI